MKKIISFMLAVALLPLLAQCQKDNPSYTKNENDDWVSTRRNLENTYVKLDFYSSSLGINQISFDTKTNHIWLNEQLYASGSLTVSYWEISRPDQYTLELKANGNDGSTFHFVGRLKYDYAGSDYGWTTGEIGYWEMKKDGESSTGNGGQVQVWDNY